MFSGGTLTPALIGVSLTAALVATPYRFTYTGPSKGLLPQTAAAQSASEGNDSGSGDESQSDGLSSTEPGDAGTSSPSDAGQNDGPLGGSNPADSGGAALESPDEKIEQDRSTQPADIGNTDQAEPVQQEPTGEETTDVPIEEANVEVQYSNGMREEIRDGRYEMTDVQGRIIINRPATESDYARLLRAIGK
jgi:hypothetical protein